MSLPHHQRITEHRWHELNASFDPRVRRDTELPACVPLYRVRVWEHDLFTVVESFYGHRSPDGTFHTLRVDYIYVGDVSIL